MAITLSILNVMLKFFHHWKEINFQQKPYNTKHFPPYLQCVAAIPCKI